ncbi:MAG: hypothetical protein AAB011_13420, partial [Candidatus Eisenbacteria bacterium]
GAGGRKRRRRGGRNRSGRRGPDAGDRPNENQGNVAVARRDDDGPPQESVESRIARIAAAFAPTI